MRVQRSQKPGTLYVVGGPPIGNLEDITFRAVLDFANSRFDLQLKIRATGDFANIFRLATAVKLSRPQQHQPYPELLEWLGRRKAIALVSDAGNARIF